MVLDDAAREDDLSTALVHELAHHEIFGEIGLQPFQSADGFEFGAAGGDGAADGEIHAVEQARGENACQKARVETEGLEARPEARPGGGAIGARDERGRGLSEFRKNNAETSRARVERRCRSSRVMAS